MYLASPEPAPKRGLTVVPVMVESSDGERHQKGIKRHHRHITLVVNSFV